jgi:thiol-disulfide isomerase/thioredoxin
MAKKTLDVILYIFLALAIIVSAVNISLISTRSEKVQEAIRLAEQQNQPAKLELIKITASSCPDCFDIDSIINNLKTSNVNITSEKTLEFSSAEAKQLVSQYKIEKLPTVIVLGEVNKSTVTQLWNQNWQIEMKDGTQVSAVYSAVNPPYLVAESGTIKGLVNLTHIVDQSCSECADLGQVINFFKQQGVKFSSEKTVDYSSSDGKELISIFGVREVPAVIISKDILDYTSIAQVWAQLNATEKQGFYALHTTVPPYRDLATDKIKGLVSVIYLNDSTCTTCYNVQVNKLILERNFGVVIENETTIDVSSDSGKALLKQYNVTMVPIMLASPDAGVYATFVQVWPQVGSVEKDGWFVMRKPEVLGSYKNLATGQVISPPQQQGGG